MLQRIVYISNLIDQRNDKLFYAIAVSVAVGQIGGIIAVPDVPLLFFVTIILSVVQDGLSKNMNWLNMLLLGISIALMVYTKYHGMLIVFFTLLSNPKLFTRYQTYVAAAISILIFAPHLYWQYIHGFHSYTIICLNGMRDLISYHSLLEYLLGQLTLGRSSNWVASDLGSHSI